MRLCRIDVCHFASRVLIVFAVLQGHFKSNFLRKYIECKNSIIFAINAKVYEIFFDRIAEEVEDAQ